MPPAACKTPVGIVGGSWPLGYNGCMEARPSTDIFPTLDYDASRPLDLLVLASGSKGNASVVVDRASGRSLLIDCGICKRDFLERCAQLGFDPARIEAVLITHEHTDHTKGLGVVLRGLAKRGVRPTLYASELVRRSSTFIQEVAPLCDQRTFSAGDALTVAGMQVFPFHTSHDAVESFGFRVEASTDTTNDVLGFMTDTGIVTGEAHEALAGARILAVECNHDEKMLRDGPYPWLLKQRIASADGHLSNVQGTDEVAGLLHAKLEHIVAMHISENNNTYGIPVRTLRAMLAGEGHDATVQAALQHGPIHVE